MDWQIRIAVFIAGILLVGYIYWDFAKKKKVQKANEKLKRQFGDLSSQLDASGFDANGVGQARIFENTIEPAAEGLVKNAASGEHQMNGLANLNKASANTDASKNATPGESIKEFISHRTAEPPTEPADLFDTDSNEATIQQEPELVFSLILQADSNTQYVGKSFLPIFLSQGLRHGEMGIFHRHQKTGSNPGSALFSLANAIAPGTFNVDTLDNFHTPALTLFMTLPGAGDAQVAYNAMVKTARLIVNELGGVILDESQSVYNERTHNHRLDQIQEYNRKPDS